MAPSFQTLDETGDEPVGSPEDYTVVQTIRQMREQAEEAKWDRLEKNRRNRDAFYGRQDWNHKQSGQSKQFLPKVAVSVEQMTGFIKKGLVQYGDWFSVEVNRNLSSLISGEQIRSIMMCFLKNLWAGNQKTTDITSVLSDAVKIALTESLIILKVHGGMVPMRHYSYDPETRKLSWEEGEEWRLRVDHVRPEDYYPDPTGNGLYEIHRLEKDLHEVLAGAESGMYDPAIVKQLIDTDFKRPEDEERTDVDRNQNPTFNPSFRKRVVLDEFWGTLLNSDGTVAHRNCVATVANDRFLIRPPEPNPFWHQESPFVVCPLVRVPWSVWHRALYDEASSLNLALNEIFNLILDGGIASVWGIKQIRLEDLEDPGQVAGGIMQGDTLAVKQTLPHNAKVIERVDTGSVPSEAAGTFEFVNREFMQAALTSEIRMGTLPAKQVRATEVMEASQSSSVTLEGIVADLESDCINPLLRKCWLTILQNADDIPQEYIGNIADSQAAHLIMRAEPEERFALLGGVGAFKAVGLSGTLAKAMDFQKLMAAIQAITSNPWLLQQTMQDLSAKKTISRILHTLGISMEDLMKDAQEVAAASRQVEAAGTGAAAALTGGSRGASAPGAEGNGGEPLGGGSGTPAAINQMMSPASGLTPNA